MYTYSYQPPTQEEIRAKRKKKADAFALLGIPSLLFALFFTLFLYDNTQGIAVPLFVLFTLGFLRFLFKRSGIVRKPGFYWYGSVMLLLGISDAFTGSKFVAFFNNCAIFLLLICLLLHHYCDDRGWTIGKYLISIASACFGAIGYMFSPIDDLICHREFREKDKNEVLPAVLIGIGIACPLLLVILYLLYTADGVFASFLSDIFSFPSIIFTLAGILFTFFFGFFSCYSGLRFLGAGRIQDECRKPKKYALITAYTILFPIALVYVLFCAVQFLYLFQQNLSLPDGYTYAEYAREGFFQLLFVSMLNLILVLLILRCFPASRLLTGLLTVISGCTYILVASSAFRMILYIQTYGLTLLRLLVLWLLAVFVLLLSGILVLIFRNRFPLFRYSLTAICVCYLVLSFVHPDYVIARYNLTASTSQNVLMDTGYLSCLSSDAAPVILDPTYSQDDELVSCFREKMMRSRPSGIRNFNFSKWYAYRLAKRLADTG